MSKLSDIGLILPIIGTFFIVLSLILSIFIASPNLFFIIQISGWNLFCIALILLIKTKDVYHIIKLKNNFPLKLEHLIIFICANTIIITFFLFVDINIYKYTGKFTYLTIWWFIVFFGGVFISYYLKKNPQLKNPRVIKAKKKNVIL